MSIRPNSAAIIRPTSAFSPTRAHSCARCWPRSSSAAAKRGDAIKAWLADIKKWQAEWDEIHRGRISTSTLRRSGRSASSPIARRCCRRTPSSCCDVGVNHNWYMQFWKARTTADHAQFLGLLRHGLRRCRRARRQARRARPSGGGDRRRRLLHHGAARAVHRGRIQHPGGVGDLEQFRLGLDPRHPARHVRRPRARHHVPSRAPTRNRTIRTSPPGRAPPASRPSRSPSRRTSRARSNTPSRPTSRSCIDVHVDAEVRPPATGAWQLPPTPYKEPVFGQRFIPDAAPVK